VGYGLFEAFIALGMIKAVAPDQTTVKPDLRGRILRADFASVCT
jgi:hypothetical protein